MEKLMQYVWQHRLWQPALARTVSGRKITIIDPGLINTGAGPDFFNAKIEIDGRAWAGNVEIHIRASDWHRHHHDGDPAYDSVILHVVRKSDCEIRRSNGEVIPQMEMPCDPHFADKYAAMVNGSLDSLGCAAEIPSLDSFHVTEWLNTVAFERLQDKASHISDIVDANGGNWGEAVYVTLARALGFGLNSQAFERLAKALPLKVMRKHIDNPDAVEGMLFGMAGFLDDISPDGDDHPNIMAREYRFMKAKFGLVQPRNLGWKMARMRPQNMPYRRLAALAQLICRDGLTAAYEIATVADLDSARALFDVDMCGYWARHLCFSQPNTTNVRAFSKNMLDILVINVVVPAMYAYGHKYGEYELAERAISFLEQIKAEDNNIIKMFAAAGIRARNALESQALIQLRRNYCETRKCLYCRFGHRFLSRKVIAESYFS